LDRFGAGRELRENLRRLRQLKTLEIVTGKSTMADIKAQPTERVKREQASRCLNAADGEIFEDADGKSLAITARHSNLWQLTLRLVSRHAFDIQ